MSDPGSSSAATLLSATPAAPLVHTWYPTLRADGASEVTTEPGPIGCEAPANILHTVKAAHAQLEELHHRMYDMQEQIKEGVHTASQNNDMLADVLRNAKAAHANIGQMQQHVDRRQQQLGAHGVGATTVERAADSAPGGAAMVVFSEPRVRGVSAPADAGAGPSLSPEQCWFKTLWTTPTTPTTWQTSR